HLTHCLHELIRVRQDGGTPLLTLAERYRPYLPAGSIAALLSATTELDHAQLEELLDGLQLRGVRPLLVRVDGDSFVPIERWARPRSERLARAEALQALLRARGVAGAVLGAEDELASVLSRPDLFGEVS